MNQMWDKKALHYPRFSGQKNEFQETLFTKLNEFGVNFNGKSLIDIGCGTGVHTIYLAGLCAEVLGVDSSEKMLKIMLEDANKFGVKNLTSLQSDFESFNPNKYYDISFCTMSPALNSENAFNKFISLADLRIHLWWNKPRFSSVLAHFYEKFALNGKTQRQSELEQFLKEQGIKFQSCILNEERVVVREFDEAVENIYWHLEIAGIKFDKINITDELLKLQINKKIEEKIISSMKLLVF